MQLQDLQQFPIFSYTEEICSTLKNSPSRILILTAETAAGKSTVLPLALLNSFSGRMIMTEPRRLAVLGVANRISELRTQIYNQDDIGYKIHLESKNISKARLEVVTEGILIRQLQSDPSLENYNLVVIDEFHERSINTDLAVAFLKEALELRNDLFVIIMSATINTQKLQSYFSSETPVLQIPGRQFPVQTIYEPDLSVEQAIFQAIKRQSKGNILTFLPGISDIRKAQENLKGQLDDNFELCILHSSISLEDQKKVIKPAPGGKRRIILSSAIAETSLTVPDVNCVIDSGLARVNRMNISTGMENLTTETESEFSAEQRKGRAGRLGPGICIRLWSEFDPRIKDFPPEILRADITELVLECADRGVFTADGIDWLDKPVAAAWKESVILLQRLSLLKSDGHITDKGKLALKLGIHPRLASIAICGFEKNHLTQKASELLLKYSSYAKSAPVLQQHFIADLEQRLLENKSEFFEKGQQLILCGYPDRVAKRQSGPGERPAEYQFASGRKALLYQGFAPEWIVAPEVMAGAQKGTIFDFEELSQKQVDSFLQNNSEKRQVSRFVEGKILKTEETCYGQIVLSTKKLIAAAEDFAAAWVTEVQCKGLECLPMDEKCKNFLLRVEFWNQQNGKIAHMEDELARNVEQWLPSFLGTSTKLTSQIVYDALYWYLDGSKIDKEVPEMLILPNGRRCKVKYEKMDEIKPVIEIIIQRIFGCFETPEICGKKVLLRLLSPASRPLQVTEDLEGFWTGAWIEICREMKGRYPKHNWDYKVVES